MVVDEHGSHTGYIFVSELKKTKTKVLRCTGYLNYKIPIMQDLLLILVLIRQQNFING